VIVVLLLLLFEAVYLVDVRDFSGGFVTFLMLVGFVNISNPPSSVVLKVCKQPVKSFS